ncbi:hypothetical protein GDO78_019507 [Eleutherodactylus coqui]|uniref:Uncharacterized protein n=1 Tax=Eleutherodactylus coqui TaxID=57060 RepID=A0A8J6EPR7_ELECQ|nr:hypothetical protein GDO78_019507 [Eleutherodactylus coqui]
MLLLYLFCYSNIATSKQNCGNPPAGAGHPLPPPAAKVTASDRTAYRGVWLDFRGGMYLVASSIVRSSAVPTALYWGSRCPTE